MQPRTGLLKSIAALAAILCVFAATPATATTSNLKGKLPTKACDKAFRKAAQVDEFHDTVSDLYPAVRKCASLKDWVAASKRNPGAIDKDVDPREFARNVCSGTQPDFQDTAVCRGAIPVKPDAVTADFIRTASDGDVTGALYDNPRSPFTRYSLAVTDDIDIVPPLGQTDKNLVVYGLDSCGGQIPPIPAEWEDGPGDPPGNIEAFAELARTLAPQYIC